MKIYLDAGHNYAKVDTGAGGNGLREEIITWHIASAVKPLLEATGLEVKLSRGALTDILGSTLNESLAARYNGANAWGADVFVSIHCNANAGTPASGTEVYYHPNSAKGQPLAKSAQAAIVKALGTIDRGVKPQSNLAVLNHTNMPAILVETAFINHPKDADLLLNRQGDFAAAIANGICEYLGIEYENREVANVGTSMDDVSVWARSAMDKAVKNGVLRGDESGNLTPRGAVTREQLAVILDRLGLLG